MTSHTHCGYIRFRIQRKFVRIYLDFCYHILRSQLEAFTLSGHTFSGIVIQWTVCLWMIIYIYIYIYIWEKSNVGDRSRGQPKTPFSKDTIPMWSGGRYSFLSLLYYTLDTYLVMQNFKEGDIKYYFLSLSYYSIWHWIPVYWAFG